VHKGALQSIKVCKWLRVKKKNSYVLTLTTISVKITKKFAKRKENSALVREFTRNFLSALWKNKVSGNFLGHLQNFRFSVRNTSLYLSFADFFVLVNQDFS
jgi:hypothetical protein